MKRTHDRLVPGRIVGILFSGGDAPGMNALLRGVVRLGWNRHFSSILAVKDGFRGLKAAIDRLASQLTAPNEFQRQVRTHVGREGVFRHGQEMVLMDHASVSDIVDRGGILVGSSRCAEFHDGEVRPRAIGLLKQLGVDVLLVCGGDGSLRGAEAIFNEEQMQVIGIPATIDNDVLCTERSLGYMTAVQTITRCVRDLNVTATACHRIMVVQTMGRDSGHLAVAAGVASGAETVVVPERDTLDSGKKEQIAKEIHRSMEQGRNHAIVLVAEGVQVAGSGGAGERMAPGPHLAAFLETYFHRVNIGGELCHVDVRRAELGQLQRGGSPVPADTMFAADLAEEAWKAVIDDARPSGVLCLVRGKIQLQPFPAPPLADRAAELKRQCDLQRDLSGYSRELPASTDTASPKRSSRRKQP